MPNTNPPSMFWFLLLISKALIFLQAFYGVLHQVRTAYCQSDTTYKDARSFCLPGLLRIYALSSHVEHVKKILICACHVYILVFLDDHAPM